MNNGSALLGARLSYECDEVDINLGMVWVYSGTPLYGHLGKYGHLVITGIFGLWTMELEPPG